jgi:hypothetical protein
LPAPALTAIRVSGYNTPGAWRVLAALYTDEPTSQVFIIRIWKEPREIPGAKPQWRGMVEWLTTREVQYFISLDKLIEFIREKTDLPEN